MSALAVNDEFYSASFDDLCEMFGVDDANFLIVKAEVYGGFDNVEQYQWTFNPYGYEWISDKGQIPVVMRGSWQNMCVTSPRYMFGDIVMTRYIRRFKVSILSQKDQDGFDRRWEKLISKKIKKRAVYNLKSKYERWLYKKDPCGACLFYFQGSRHYLDRPKYSAVKSILRQIRKLEKLHPNTSGESKWQRLIQQAI